MLILANWKRKTVCYFNFSTWGWFIIHIYLSLLLHDYDYDASLDNSDTISHFAKSVQRDALLENLIFNCMTNFMICVGFHSQSLTLSWRRPLPYRTQSIELRSKSMDCFLYDNGLRHERGKDALIMWFIISQGFWQLQVT